MIDKNKIWKFITWNPNITWKQWIVYFITVLVAWVIGMNFTENRIFGIIMAEIILVTILFLYWYNKK